MKGLSELLTDMIIIISVSVLGIIAYPAYRGAMELVDNNISEKWRIIK